MKKSIKILTLVLSLALICGALVVAAFAEGETNIVGITTYAAADFENAKTFTYTPGTAKNFGLDQDGKKAVNLDYKKSGGDVVLKKNEIDGNTYFYMDWGTKYEAASGSDTPYLQAFGGNGWANVPSADKGELLTEMKYYVFDFDISFSAPQQFESGTIQHSVYYSSCAADSTTPTASGSGTSYNNFDTFKLSLSNDNNVVTISINGESEKAVVGANGSWSHVTWILEPYTVTDANGENFAAKMYLVVDGVIIDVVDHVNNLDSSKFTGGDRTLFYSRDTRINAVGSPAVGSACFDNIALRSFASTYNGNLATVLANGVGAELAAWESNLYDASKMPAGIPLAQLGETYYTDLQAAIDAANAGDTITLCGNVTGTVTINKPLTINCGEYKMADPVISGPYVYAYDAESKVSAVTLAFLTENTEAGCYFTITSGEITYYTDDIYRALTLAPTGSTVTLNKDYEEAFADSVGVITGELTIDLNGHRLCISQSDYDAYITIATNDTVTIKNGVIVASGNNKLLNSGEGWAVDRKLDGGIPVFVAYEGANGVTGLAVDLVVDNVDTYVPTIFHNESATGSKFTLNGGNHQALSTTIKLSINGTKTNNFGNGGVIQSRTNTVAEFNNANIYMTYCSSLFANSHKNVPSGTDSYTKLTYTDCTLIQLGIDKKPIILYSDSNTYAYFNGCDIYGAFMTPSKEAGEAFGSKNVIFGEGTRHGWATSYTSGGTTYNVTTFEPTIAEGIQKFTFNSTMKFSDTITVGTAGQFHINDGGVAAFLTVKNFSKSWTCNYAYGNHAFEIVKGGVTTQRPNTDYYTIKEAIADADEGSTITLLADTKIGATSQTTINKNLTIDLNGHLLNAFLPYHYASDQYYCNTNGATNYKITNFVLSADKTVTFKGEQEGSAIIFGCYTNAGQTPVIGIFITPGKNSTINFEGANLNVSGPQLVGSWGATGWTLNFNGGYYNKNNSSDGVGYIYANAASTGVTININNAYYNTNIAAATGAKTVVNIKNTVLAATAYSSSYADATFNVSDSYIFNALKPNKVVLGANCYIADTTWLSAATTTFAEGVGVGFGSNSIDHVNYSQKFAVITDENGRVVIDPNATVFTKETVTKAYGVTTVEASGYKFSAQGSDGLTYYSNDLATIIKEVAAGTTVKLLADYTIETASSVASIDKALTLDLNGHTITVIQEHQNANFDIRATSTVTIKNGTFIAGANNSYANIKGAANYAAPLFRTNATCDLVFDNVTFYGSTVVYNYGQRAATPKVTFNKFNYYGIFNQADATSPSIVDSRGNIAVTVTDSNLYLEIAYLLSSTSNKVTGANTVKKSTFIFDNCKIYSTDSSRSVISNANNRTFVEFTNCDIIGKFSPSLNNWDKNAGDNVNGVTSSAMPAANIIFNEGCRWGYSGTSALTPTCKNGIIYLGDSTSTNDFFPSTGSFLNYQDGAFTIEDGKFVLPTVASSKTATYNYSSSVVEGVDYVFEYVKGGVTYWTPETSTDTIVDILNVATVGSTIKLLRDYTWKGTKIKYVQRDYTLDLGGFTFTHQQSLNSAKNYTTSYLELQNGTFTIKNGTIRAMLLDAEGNDTGKNYPFIRMTYASAVYKSITLNVENVNTYVGPFIYNMTAPGATINITGGEHHLTNSYQNVSGSFIESRANTNATVTGAKFNVSNSTNGLVISMSYNQTTGDKASSFVFDGCEIVCNSSSKNIVPNSNEFTTIAFNNCKIVGSINPAKHSFDSKLNGPKTGSIVLDSATTLDAYLVLADVVSMSDAAMQQFNFKYTANGAAYLRYATLAEIVNTAMSYDGSVVTFLADVTFQPTGYMNITKNVTFDLNGHVLTLIHDGQDKTFNLNAAVTARFENGTIITTPGASYASENRTFCFVYVSKNNANLVFDGVSGRVTTLVYAWGASYTITVNDGTFVLDTVAGGMNTSGFISGQANITATVNNTTLFVENSYILGASSYKQFANLNGTTNTIESVKEAIKSTFTFNNCNIIGNNVNKNLISNANEFTTVTFNGGTIYGNIAPIKNGSDGTLNYVQIGNKFYTNPTACTCATFSDTNGDGKCDNVVGESACGKFDPASIKSFTFAESTNANFIIGKGTYFSASTNVKVKTTLAEKLIVQNIAENITIGGINYSFDYVADYVYVIWHDANGNELNKVPVDGNFTGIVAPEYTVPTTGANNGWYQIGGFVQGGWTTTFGGTTAVDFSTITEFTANLNFYPQASGGITAYLSAAMYNLSIVGQIRNNFYIPVDMPENVKILGVYIVDENGNKIKDVSGTEILFKDHRNEPVYYTMYVINYVDAIALTESTRVWVDYTVNDITLTQKYTISPEKYVNTVYADYVNETEQYNDAAYNVVADLVRYSYFISVYANAESAAITDLYNKVEALCSKLPTDMTPDASVDTSNLAGLGTIAFEASEFNPRWKFTLNESAKIVDIKITLQGYNNGVLDNRTNFGTQTYGITSVTKVNGYITSAYTVNIPVYNLIQPFTITMTKADGTEISAIFDLNSYYQSVKGTAAAADFLESVVALANSTIAYKFPDGKVTVNDIADFWECDHPADMVNKLDEVVAYTNVFKPHYCQKCDSYLFYYEDYGAVADGKTAHNRATHISGTNNYEAIYWTHANANEWKARTDLSGGKHVAVIGNTNPTVAKNYYISLPEGIGLYKIDTNRDGVVDTVYKNGQNLGSIIVATDTSWNGVNLLIDDDTICNNYASNYDSKDPNKPTEPCDCGRKHAYVDQPIFILDEYASEKIEQNWKGKLTSLSAGATNIGFAPGRDMLVHLVDADKKIYLRYGANASNGNAISEVILVHRDGSIDPSTPVQWDYTNLNNQDSDKVIAYAADAEEIKISGLDANGQINAIFETYVNNDVKQYLYHYEQSARNITINRSNATVEGLDRIFLEEAADNANNTNDRMAYTFIKVELCSDVTIKDMLVMNHNSHAGDTGTSQGSYEFSAGNANDVKWINCDTKNMFSAGKDGSLLAYPVYRGLFGTNHTRNMYLADCFLNSFDAHTGAYNVTIERSTFDHMNFIGGGLIKLTDVTVYTASNYGSAINLRKDYGSTWNGDLEIDGLTVRYGLGDKPERITLIYGSYVNQYWGFDTYMPQNVTINNFHVESYTATVEDTNGDNVMDKRIERSAEYTITYEDIDFDGVMDKRTEDLEAKNNESYGKIDGNIYVYYYYGAGDKDGYDKSVSAGHIHNLSASKVPAASAAGKHGPEDKGDSSIKYDYGTNHLECTKNLTITNSVEFNLPTGDFWKNMNFSMNGSKYVWTEKKIGNYVISAKFEKQ